MIDVARENDIERLRQMAVILEKENDRLHRRLREISGADAERMQLELESIREQLAQQQRAIFGASSEKRTAKRDGDNNGKPAEQAPQAGHGPTPQAELPIVERIHELDDAKRACPECGEHMPEMDGQFEDSEVIDVVERSFRIVKIKRRKYRCRCGNHIATAEGAPKLIDGGRYTPGFAAEVAVSKYVDHMPLARQVRQMKRQGLDVSSQTLWDQLYALSKHLEPTYQAVREYVLESEVISADETTWKLMDDRCAKTHWAWSASREDAVFYHIAASRSAAAAADLLGEYSATLLCDGYSGYSALRKQRAASRDGPEPFDLAHCWAHVRRKFVQAEPHYGQAAEMLEMIAELYAVDAEAGCGVGDDVCERRRHLRQLRSREIVARIRKWMLAQRVLPKSTLGRAIRYTDGIWPGLVRFLDDPRIALDNNQTERAMRGVAIGRKNHYGSRSLRGTRAAALFYTLVETAKLSGVEPAAYIREAALRAIREPGAATLPRDLITN